MKDKTSDAVFDWNVTGASISYLALEVCVIDFIWFFQVKSPNLCIKFLLILYVDYTTETFLQVLL